MDQERDDATQRATVTGSDDTARLRADIDATKAQMSGTIGELHDRLSPDHLAHRAGTAIKQAVNDRVRGVVASANTAAHDAAGKARASMSQAASQVRRHPVPASVAVGTAGWLLMQRRERASYTDAASVGAGLAAGALAYYAATQMLDTAWSDHGSNGRAESAVRRTVRGGVDRARASVAALGTSAAQAAQQYAGTIGESAHRYAETLGETAGQYAGRIGETTRQAGAVARDRVSEAGEILSDQTDEWGELIDRWMAENPLALGAATFALGVVAGLSLPGTRMENRALGPTRDSIVDRVHAAVDDALPG